MLAGTDATFVLSASNAGPSDAANVTVTDTLPANLSFDSYTGTGWTCVAVRAGRGVQPGRHRRRTPARPTSP